MSPIGVILYITGLAVGTILFSRFLMYLLGLEHSMTFGLRSGLGGCPGCHAPLTKENMIEGSTCGDGRFYCDRCKAFARCGC